MHYKMFPIKLKCARNTLFKNQFFGDFYTYNKSKYRIHSALLLVQQN